ncbi:MAG: GTPase [Thermosynechococcaceae cyanobacterium]
MMIRLKPWQWGVLVLPFLAILGFLGVAASLQIHQWHLNWIWAIIAVILVGWRVLLVRWLRSPELAAAEAALDQWTDATALPPPNGNAQQRQLAEVEIRQSLQAAREEGPPWDNWPLFFQRCQRLVEAIALIYHPQVKRPLLNIYVPQAYGLIRGTVDDVDQWMQKLSPLLGQVTLGQAYEAYETYQKLEPAARLALKAWTFTQWIFNPLAALARAATQGYAAQANQQLVTNLGQMLREATLKALGERAIALYSGEALQAIAAVDVPMPTVQTQTLRDIFGKATELNSPDTQPLNVVLLGRTGAGKSSLINTLFRQDLAQVDVLPSTNQMQPYQLEIAGEFLLLWDSPGYEQVGMAQYTQTVIAQATAADLVLLVMPVTDPTLQMDRERLSALKQSAPDLPILTVVTQVDRLRPLREWDPPYDWQKGDRPKERHIREAIAYRQALLQDWCEVVLPLATEDLAQHRTAWGVRELSQAILNTVAPAKQFRLSRFLQDLETRTQTAAKIIDHYAFQMGTTQGLTALLKSPALRFLSTLMTGSPALAIVLAEKLPLEQSPVVVGKLQMAFELYSLLSPDPSPLKFELLRFWPLLTDCSAPIAQEAWALGHTLAEYWTQPATTPHLANSTQDGLGDRYQGYLQRAQTHFPQK